MQIKIEKIRAAISAGLILAGIGSSAWSAPVDLSSPGSTMGYADAKGRATYELEYQWADFGNGVKMPFRVIFGSDSDGDLTRSIPLFESSAYTTHNGGQLAFSATISCGKSLRFHPAMPDSGSGGGIR